MDLYEDFYKCVNINCGFLNGMRDTEAGATDCQIKGWRKKKEGPWILARGKKVRT